MKDFIRDIIDQLWTLLGMFIAWFVLDGSAKDIVGWAILWSLGIWVLTYRLRNPKEQED
jgi:putative Mn2+ efflux pump MntP